MLGEYARPTVMWDTVMTAVRLHTDDETFQTLIRTARLDHYDPRTESVVVQVPIGTNRVAFHRRAVPALEKAFANVLGLQPRIHVEEVNFPAAPPQRHREPVAQQTQHPELDPPVRSNQAVQLAPASNGVVQPAQPQVTAPSLPTSQAAAPAQVESRGLLQFPLNPKFTFESFVAGPSNRMALSVARQVAESPGGSYNPLFVYGNVGLGKTHLLQAICHDVLRRRPRTSIRYLSCEQFVNDYIEALGQDRQQQFRRDFRGIDMLVIDDIHFLANKEATQEEFFHTFNDLSNTGRQIILSSDSAPKEIPQLEERLVSRFLAGISVKIEAPCTETREAIVAAKAAARNIAMPREVIQFIAESVRSNIRELEGAVTQVAATAEMMRLPVSLAVAHDALRELAAINAHRRTSIDDIVAATCGRFGVRTADLQSQRRTRTVTLPRQVAMFLCKRHTQKTLAEIGGFFGGRDHTTVLHSIRKIEEDVKNQLDLAQHIEQIERELMLGQG